MVLTGSALAADLPLVKAPPPVVASWAGFYLGVHGGYGWKKDDFSTSEVSVLRPDAMINGIRSKGAVYGAQAGYNWQLGRLVTGFEIDVSAADIKGSNCVSGSFLTRGPRNGRRQRHGRRTRPIPRQRPCAPRLAADGQCPALWHRRSRLGAARSDRDQVVNTPTETQNGEEVQRPPLLRTPTDKFGWVAGVGAEVMLGSPNWIGRLEYLHYDLGQIATATSFALATGNRPCHQDRRLADHRCGTRRGFLQVRRDRKGRQRGLYQGAGCGAIVVLGRLLSRRPWRVWLGQTIRPRFRYRWCGRRRYARFDRWDKIQRLGRRRAARSQLAV